MLPCQVQYLTNLHMCDRHFWQTFVFNYFPFKSELALCQKWESCVFRTQTQYFRVTAGFILQDFYQHLSFTHAKVLLQFNNAVNELGHHLLNTLISRFSTAYTTGSQWVRYSVSEVRFYLQQHGISHFPAPSVFTHQPGDVCIVHS